MPTVDRRLIEDWLPINEISIEAIRERAGAVPNPETHQLHVWWARRPLVFSRSAIAASLLDKDADRAAFTAALGTYPQIVQDQTRIDDAKARGERLKPPVYVNPRRPLGKDNHKRAFTHNLTEDERDWFRSHLAVDDPLVLDVTAGGGSIPFEAGRLGLRSIANELNPVAAIILRATCALPQRHGKALVAEYRTVAQRFRERVRELLDGVYPSVPDFEENFFETLKIKKSRIARAQRYVWASLWARAIRCPSCGRSIPLSPNWRLSSSGDGIRLIPNEDAGTCDFEIVTKASEQSPGTIKRGIVICPYPSCGDSAPRDYPAAEAAAGRMGHILYCIIYRNEIYTYTKAGKITKRPKTIRTFAAPRPEDRDMSEVRARLANLKPKWDADDILPSEEVPPNGNKTRDLHRYGMTAWTDIFTPRQRLAHGYCVQAFRELVDLDKAAGEFSEIRKAAWLYVALGFDKLIARNSVLSRWDGGTSRVANIFDTHDFGMKWSYGEMTVTIEGLGLDWALDSVAKCIDALTQMAGHPEPSSDKSTRSDNPALMESDVSPDNENPPTSPLSNVTVFPAQDLDMQTSSADAIVFDPPYHDNVNYAELSDFFYVWLKRMVGHVYHDLCRAYLSDKVNEAIASPARFRDAATKNEGETPRDLATDDYYRKMAGIFRECRRVIKEDGVMTVMFTHKSTDAWDALITALIESEFRITRTWPVKTEANALNILGNASARSTILLVCRPMSRNPAPKAWHEVESIIEREVHKDIERIGAFGLKPVDMYLAAFGPALRVISEHWGTEREAANPERPEDEFSVTPTDAMQVARREVSRHRVARLSRRFTRVSDPTARFYILAADASAGDTMDYDEALLLARAAGYDINSLEAKSVIVKSGSKITLKTAQDRLAEDNINPNRITSAPLDQVHVAIALTARQDSAAARNWLTAQGIDINDDVFKGTLEALHAAQKPGNPDNAPARSLYTLLYSEEPPRQEALGL